MRKRICLIVAAAILLIAGVMLAGVLFGDAPVSHVTVTDPERYLSDRDAAIDQLRYAQRMLTDTDFIDAVIQALEEELTNITGMLRLCIAENAANTMTEETYRTTHAELCSRFEETEAKLAALQKQRDKMKADAVTIGGMMFELGELDTLPVIFDEKLWHGTIDHVTVHADERMVFHFKDGKEIVTML